MNPLEKFEKNKLGKFSIVSSNAEPGWKLKGNVDAVKRIFKRLAKNISRRYPAVEVLRLAIITSDVTKEYNKIAKIIGKSEIIDPLGGRMIAGKGFSWGNEDVNNLREYYSGIILNEEFVAQAVFGEGLGLALLAHELTHIGESIEYERCLGTIGDNICVNEWDKTKKFIASSLNGERAANFMACPYIKGDQNLLIEQIFEPCGYLTQCRNYLIKAYQAYEENKDKISFYSNSISPTSRIFDAIGRSIGLIEELGEKERECVWERFVQEIARVDYEWAGLTIELRKQLQIIGNEYPREEFDKLEELVGKGFRIMGFEPHYENDGEFKVKLLFDE